MKKITVAVDVMGGDNAPNSVIEGINTIVAQKSINTADVQFLLYAVEQDLVSSGAKLSAEASSVCEFIYTSARVSDNWKVTEALKRGPGTTMWEAVNAVATQKAQSVVSAGNTGALMAISKMLLKTLPNIARPAIIGRLPSSDGKTIIMLDLGANTTCVGENLVQFAVMGDAYCKVISKIKKPRVSILNIGSEDIKGLVSVRAAGKALQKYNELGIINYVGFLEGSKLFSNEVDVVVSDGFSGNIGLKIVEGTSKYVLDMLKKSVKNSLLAKLGMLLLLPALKGIRKQVDYRNYNGAMLIGLNGISVKAHGVSDRLGMANAILNAYHLAEGDINSKILEELQKIPFSDIDYSI